MGTLRIWLVNTIVIAVLAGGDLSMHLNTARIAYHNERDYARARKACLEGIEHTKKNFELYAILCGCEIGLGNWQAAATALLNALNVDSTKTRHWINKEPQGESYYYQAFLYAAKVLFGEGKYEQALEFINYALPDISTYSLKGAILYRLGRKAEASVEYQKALECDPENPDVNFMLGKVLLDQQLYDSCTHYMEAAKKQYGAAYARVTDTLQCVKAADNLSQALYHCGLAYHYARKETLALADFTASLRLKPNDIDALYFSAEALINLARYDEAVPCLEKAVELKQDDHYAWFYLAVCRTKSKNYNEAIDIFENKVLVLDPDNVDAMLNLAFLYKALGEQAKATFYLIKADSLQKK